MRTSSPHARRGVSRAAYAVVGVVLIAIIGVGAYIGTTSGNVTTVTSTSVSTSTAVSTSVLTSTAVSTSVSTSTATVTSAATPQAIKVALVMEGAQEDGSFNQEISTDLSNIVNASNGLISASYIDNVAIASAAQVAGTYAQQGYQLVVGDTNDYAVGFGQAAAQFPHTDFVTEGGSIPLTSNTESYTIWANEAAYVEGYLAAYLTHTDKVGDIVAEKSNPQLAWTNGFYQGLTLGADQLNKTITVTNSWTNSYTDPSTGVTAANALLSSGVDFIAEDASAPGSGAQSVVGQAYVNSTVGPFATGAFTNQNSLGPYIVSSTPWDFTTALQTVISQVQDGTFGNQTQNYFLHTGAVSVVLSSTVPPAVAAKVNTLIAEIKDGSVVVPLVPSPDLVPSGVAIVGP
jgi:basic membrane protein A and related proteins